jgi:hypothetical protein
VTHKLICNNRNEFVKCLEELPYNLIEMKLGSFVVSFDFYPDNEATEIIIEQKTFIEENVEIPEVKFEEMNKAILDHYGVSRENMMQFGLYTMREKAIHALRFFPHWALKEFSEKKFRFTFFYDPKFVKALEVFESL